VGVLRSLVALAWSAVVFLAAGLLGLVTFRLASRPLATGLPYMWGRVTLALLGVRLDVRGRDNLADGCVGGPPLARTRVVLVNHASTLDTPVMGAMGLRAPLVLGKKELRYLPLFNLVWWSLGQVFLDRQDPQRARAALDGVVRVAGAAPRTILIAPEGTRSPDGRLGAFRTGAVHLAIALQCPIVPVVIHGASGLMPLGRFWATPGTLRVEVQPEIPTAGWDPADARRHSAELEQRYRGWLGEDGPRA
jgi:1-acyl-sn-glycerol-3-phosphate acyltransferase